MRAARSSAPSKRSHDNGVGACMPEAGDGVLANAAIRREKNLRAGLVDHLPCLGQPVLGLRVEPDTLDSHPCPRSVSIEIPSSRLWTDATGV